MTTDLSKPIQRKWRRRFYALLACWLASTILLSFNGVRGLIVYPIYVHESDASAEAAYVMADGYAYWERLRAASDLYHEKKIKRILILDEQTTAAYNYVRKRSETRVQRAIDYLVNQGVPQNCITAVEENTSAMLGSLSEAQMVARNHSEIKSLVVVTSAPHTRRSLLCFQRSLPDSVDLHIFAASNPANSVEINSPIWVEYLKLAVYFFVA